MAGAESPTVSGHVMREQGWEGQADGQIGVGARSRCSGGFEIGGLWKQEPVRATWLWTGLSCPQVAHQMATCPSVTLTDPPAPLNFLAASLHLQPGSPCHPPPLHLQPNSAHGFLWGDSLRAGKIYIN